eukprot:jgi/Tetstr1/456479/TSEL_043202.t1
MVIDVAKNTGVITSVRMAHRAKEMIREEDDKSYVESFKKLLAWVDAFMQRNPGSLASMKTENVPIENQQNYEWFLDKCTEAGLAVWLEGTERKMAVISDRDKGLAPAVANRLPSVHRRQFTRHIIGNMKDRKDIPSKFGPKECMVWDVQKQHTLSEFTETMNLLREYNPKAAEYLGNIPHSSWAAYTATDDGIKLYGWRSSNFVESGLAHQLQGTIQGHLLDPVKWFSEMFAPEYRVSTYLEGYSGAHEVVIPHMCDLPADNVLLPPPLNRQRGRPSKHRFRSAGEGCEEAAKVRPDWHQ